jgi:hypothetical protein
MGLEAAIQFGAIQTDTGRSAPVQSGSAAYVSERAEAQPTALTMRTRILERWKRCVTFIDHRTRPSSSPSQSAISQIEFLCRTTPYLTIATCYGGNVSTTGPWPARRPCKIKPAGVTGNKTYSLFCRLTWPEVAPLLLPGLLFGTRFHILVLGYLYAGEEIEIARRT